MQRARLSALGLALVIGTSCGPDARRPRAVGVDGAEPVAAEAGSANGAGKNLLRVCAVAGPKATNTPLGNLSHVVELASRSFYLARLANDAVSLVQLGASGELVETRLPPGASQMAREGSSRLRFFVDGKSPSWVSVDLSNPDAPSVGGLQPAPGLAHAGTLKAFVSDGERALLGRYMVDYDQQPPRYHGETALHSVPDGQRTSPVVPMTAWSGACRHKRCVAAASAEGLAVPVELIGLSDGGYQKLGRFDDACGWSDWVQGDRWIVALSTKAGIDLWGIDLASWKVSKRRISLDAECPKVEHIELGGRPGLLYEPQKGRSRFAPVTAALRLGAPETLPSSSFQERKVAPLPDAALWVEQTVGHGMMHSPTDREIRRYYQVWSFDGRATLLHREPRAGWAAEKFESLPHSGEEGKFSGGFRAHPLVRPGFAAVFIDQRPAGKSELLLVGRPCPD